MVCDYNIIIYIHIIYLIEFIVFIMSGCPQNTKYSSCSNFYNNYDFYIIVMRRSAELGQSFGTHRDVRLSEQNQLWTESVLPETDEHRNRR